MTSDSQDKVRRLAPEATWIDIGKVGRPHGLDGRVHLHPFHAQSDVWEVGARLRAYLPGKPAFPLEIVELRLMNGALIARFDGYPDRTTATALTHAMLSVSEADLPPPSKDEFYLHEVVGAEVLDAATRVRVGVVTGILTTNMDLLDIRLDSGGTALLPVQADALESLGREKGIVVVRDIEDWRSE